MAIDPGSAKCGVAVVASDKSVLWSGMATTDALIGETERLIAAYKPVALIVGKGTGSRPIIERIRSANLPPPLCLVPEAYTTMLARERYLDANPPRGWRRLLPRSLLTPSVPVDDYVAVILAERYWDETR